MRALQCRTKLAQTGLSIVELMVAMALGLLIIGGILYTFISSRPVFTANDAVARIQEDGRIAMERLTREVRQAGYTGCANSLDVVPKVIVDLLPAPNGDGTPDMASDDVGSIRVFNGEKLDDGTESWTPPVNISRVKGTDVIQLKGIGSCQRKLTGNMGAVNANIQIGSNPCGWEAGQILVIADCTNVDIFAATNVSTDVSTGSVTIAHSEAANIGVNLSKPYGTEAVVFGYGEKTFFVGIPQGGSQPLLYEITYNGAGTPDVYDIAGNVYDLQVLSVKTDTDSDGAANADVAPSTLSTADDWSKAIGLRVQFSVRSEADNTGPESKTYMFNGVSVTDKRLRRDFVTNIGIRNRLP